MHPLSAAPDAVGMDAEAGVGLSRKVSPLPQTLPLLVCWFFFLAESVKPMMSEHEVIPF